MNLRLQELGAALTIAGKFIRAHQLRASTLLAVVVLVGSQAPEQAGAGGGAETGVIPQIVMENVPLQDAIKNLARQADLNYILDPRLTGAVMDADGKYVQRQASITKRWTNATAQQALDAILKANDLVAVESPATAVTRIAPRNANVKPVPASAIVSNTNAPIPLIVMDEVPLSEAINNLARQANLNVVLDPKLNAHTPGPNGRIAPPPMVTVRWTQVTARQALAALLDNYDLAMTENPATSTAQIKSKDQNPP